jgi:hypothetical protein
VIEVEPIDTSDCPYEGVVVGDIVEVPNLAGDGTESLRVLSISVETDDEGYAIWRMELNARWRDPDSETVELLRSIGGKTLGNVAQHGVAKD